MTIKSGKGLIGLILAISFYLPIHNVSTQDAHSDSVQAQKQGTDSSVDVDTALVDPRIQEVINFIFRNSDEDFNQKIHDFFLVLHGARLHFIDEKTSAELLTLAMKGMISGLDPYSNLFIDKEVQEMRKGFSENRYPSGVGMSFGRFGKYIYVTEVYEGFPADKAGIESGDMIKTINGKDVYGMDSSQIGNLMRGPKGTIVSVELMSQRLQKPTIVKLIRQEIKIKSVVYKELDDGIAYIKVKAFKKLRETGAEFSDALLRASRNSRRLIVDLRNNHGGSVETVVDMVGNFVEPGKVVMVEKERYGAIRFNITEKKRVIPNLYPKKIVILVNNNSASASEIMAGSLQYYGVAEVVGIRTFGKARIQVYMDLEKEDHTVDENTRLLMGVTTGRYFLPGGENRKGDNIGQDITNIGVMPDIEVEQSNDFRSYEYGTLRDAQFQAAIKFLKKN